MAESELAEGIEGLIMNDSVDVMIEELAQRPYAKVIRIDYQAAVTCSRSLLEDGEPGISV